MSSPLDCLVIGAGPAGLTAAIYLARFHLSVRVIDAGHSRAALIPRTRNHAGFPDGISGRDLLQRMRRQAEEFGTSLADGTVEKLERSGEGFVVHSAEGATQALTVLLATGVVNNRPPIAPELHDLALSRGLLRYCPICDGYEVTDQQVGVIGTGGHGAGEAAFLRMYTPHVTLIAPAGAHELSAEDRSTLERLGVRLEPGPCEPLRIDGDVIEVPSVIADAVTSTVVPEVTVADPLEVEQVASE